MKLPKDATRHQSSLGLSQWGLSHWPTRAALLVLVLVLCIEQAAYATTPTLYSVVQKDHVASTEEIQRSIRIIRNDVRVAPRLNMPLEIGDEIITDPESTVVIRYPNGSEVYLRPNTHVKIQSIYLLYGELFAKVKGAFRVETSFAAAGVEGTEFSLRVDPDNQLSVIVLDGVVNLSPKIEYGESTRPWNSISIGKDEKAVIGGKINDAPKFRELHGRETSTQEVYKNVVPVPGMAPLMKKVPQKKRASEEELNAIKQWTNRVEQLTKRVKQ